MTVSESPAVEPTTDITVGFGGGLGNEPEPGEATVSVWESPPVDDSPNETPVVDEPKPQEHVAGLWSGDPEPTETGNYFAVEENPVEEPIPETTPETGLTDRGLWDASADDEVRSDNPVIEPAEEREAKSSSLWTAEAEAQQDMITETEATEPESQQETDFKTEPLRETEEGDSSGGDSAAGEDMDAGGLWEESDDSAEQDISASQPEETVVVDQNETTDTPPAVDGLLGQEQPKDNNSIKDESPEQGLVQDQEATGVVLSQSSDSSSETHNLASEEEVPRKESSGEQLELPTSVTWGKPEKLAGHFEDHGDDVEAGSQDEYARKASEFLQRAQKDGFPAKIDPSDGTIRIFDPETGIFAAYNSDGTTRTIFKPKRGREYFDDDLRCPGQAPTILGGSQESEED